MRKRLSPTIYFALVRVLVSGAESGRSYSVNELKQRLEMAHSTMWKWMRILRENDLVYIKTWKRAGNIWVACYAWGFKEDDAPRPTPLPQTTHEKNYRARLQAKKGTSIATIVKQLDLMNG
jgi:hypothetical protein